MCNFLASEISRSSKAGQLFGSHEPPFFLEVDRKRVLWTCLEVVSCGQFHFSSSGYQQSSAVVNTKHELVSVALSCKNSKVVQKQLAQVSGSGLNIPRSSLEGFSLQSEDQGRPRKFAWSRNARAPSHCFWNSVYILSKHRSASQVSVFSKTSHNLSQDSLQENIM